MAAFADIEGEFTHGCFATDTSLVIQNWRLEKKMPACLW